MPAHAAGHQCALGACLCVWTSGLNADQALCAAEHAQLKLCSSCGQLAMGACPYCPNNTEPTDEDPEVAYLRHCTELTMDWSEGYGCEGYGCQQDSYGGYGDSHLFPGYHE